MKALIINCTLKPSPKFSNTGSLIKKAESLLKESGAKTEVIRLVDYEIKPGNATMRAMATNGRSFWRRLKRVIF